MTFIAIVLLQVYLFIMGWFIAKHCDLRSRGIIKDNGNLIACLVCCAVWPVMVAWRIYRKVKG